MTDETKRYDEALAAWSESIDEKNKEMEERERKAFEAGWAARGNACYPSPSDWEFDVAWEVFKEARK